MLCRTFSAADNNNNSANWQMTAIKKRVKCFLDDNDNKNINYFTFMEF